MGILRRASVFIMAHALLAGCVMIDSALPPRVSSLNFAVDQAQNDSILTNIVRAGQRQPLTFVGISKVGGTQGVSMNNGLPTLSFGPDLISTQKQFIFGNNTVNNQASGNFDVSALTATRDFTRGLLSDLSLSELQLILKQGVTRELLFMLAIDAIEFSEPTISDYPKVGKLVNDPSNVSFNMFRLALKVAIRYGFTIESKQVVNDLWAPDDKSGSQPRILTASRFCFHPQLNSTGEVVGRRWLCEGDWANNRGPFASPPQPRRPRKKAGGKTRGAAPDAPPPPPPRMTRSAVLPGGDFNESGVRLKINPRVVREVLAENAGLLRIDPKEAEKLQISQLQDIVFRIRSLYGVFTYLGRQVTAADASPLLVQDEPETLARPPVPLLTVVKDGGDCFAQVTFESGRYCVPQGAASTKRTFAVISQLLALKTQQGDLPFIPTVRITP
jgi:hypothetical protein